MNLNYKRHKLLGLLSDNKIKFETNSTQGGALGVSYEDIFEALDCNEVQLQHITSVLYKEKEVGYHDAYGVKGLFMTSDGLLAYSEKKYKKIHFTNLKGYAKDFVQIAIPVLSLLVAVIVIAREDSIIAIETQAIEQKVTTLQMRIDKLEAQTQTHPIDSLKTDE